MCQTAFLFVLLVCLLVSGCTGIPGMIATQVGGQLVAGGANALTREVFGPPWWETAAKQQYQAQRVECKILDGKEYCRPVPVVSVDVSTQQNTAPSTFSTPISPSRREEKTIKQGDCIWRSADGGKWDCPPKAKENSSPSPAASAF